MSKQVKRKFGKGCLISVGERKVVLTDPYHKYIVFTLSDFRSLVRLWNGHDEALLESLHAAKLVHLHIPGYEQGALVLACGIETTIETVRFTKRVHRCTCPKCIETLVNKDKQ